LEANNGFQGGVEIVLIAPLCLWPTELRFGVNDIFFSCSSSISTPSPLDFKTSPSISFFFELGLFFIIIICFI